MTNAAGPRPGRQPGPEPIAVTDRVAAIALPLPLPDLRAVNAYAIHSHAGVTLIDPGWAYPPSEDALLAGLDHLGYGVSDVRRIVATHQHWDHYSLGARWRDRYGIELLLGVEERHSIAAYAQAPHAVHPAQEALLLDAGAPALAAEIARLEWEPYERGVAFPPPDRWLHDGDVVDCGVTSMTIHATPGHTRGHVVLRDAAQGLLFTGDHLLPRITPSLAFERAPERLPLRSYLTSLQSTRALPDARMLPAHGVTTGRTWARSDELLAHHRARLTEIEELVHAGHATSFGVAQQMRWTRRLRRLDELEVVHRMTAVLEVRAHLDVLVLDGRLSARQVDGVTHVTAP